MYLQADSFSKVTRTQINEQVATATAAAEHALYAVGELTELNLAAATASLHDAKAVISRAAVVHDIPTAFQVMQNEVQPTAEKMTSYVRHMGEINLQMQSDISKVFNMQVAKSLPHINELIGILFSAAPRGMEPLAETAKAQVSTIHNAYEKLARVNQQMLDGYYHQLVAFSGKFSPEIAPVKSVKPKKPSSAAND